MKRKSVSPSKVKQEISRKEVSNSVQQHGLHDTDPARAEQEKLRAEHVINELRESIDYYISLLNCVEDTFILKDSHHRWIFVNDAFCVLTGYSREMLLGKSDYDFFPKEEADIFWEKDDTVLKYGKDVTSEETITDSLGRRRNLVTKKFLLRKRSGESFVVAIGRDVTEEILDERRMGEIRSELKERYESQTQVLSGTIKLLEEEISDRKKAESALRISEERYKLLFDEAPISLWVEDFTNAMSYLKRAAGDTADISAFLESRPDVVEEYARLMKVIDVNKYSLQLFGARTKRELFENLRYIVPENSLATLREEIIELYKGKTEFTVQAQNRTLHGAAIDIVINCIVIQNKPENIRVLLAIQDVTAFKQMDNELKRAQLFFRELINASPDGIVAFDPKGNITYASPMMLQMVGIHSYENENIYSFIAEQDIAQAQEMLFQVAHKPMANKQRYRIKRANGEQFIVEVNTAVVKNTEGIPTGFISILRDQTQKIIFEKYLDASNKRFRILFDNHPLMIFVLDTSGIILAMNRAAETGLGYTASELLGTSVVQIFYEEDMPVVIHQVKQFLAEPLRNTWVLRKVTKDHRVIFVKEIARLIEWEENQNALLISCEDITNDLEAEHTTRKENEDLAVRFAEQSSALSYLEDSVQKYEQQCTDMESDFEMLFSALPSPALIFAYRLIRVNGAACDFFGMPADVLLASDPKTLFVKGADGEGYEGMEEICSTVLAGSSISVSWKLKKKNNRVVTATLRFSKVTVEGEPAVLIFIL